MGPIQRDRLTVVPLPGTVPSLGTRTAPPQPGADLRFLDLVERACTLRVLGAWAELRSLVCEDAWLESLAARGFAGREASIEAMRFAASGGTYTVLDFEIEALGEEAALVSTSIAQDDRGTAVTTRLHWLLTGRDGLIWRSRSVASRAEAERLLGSEGPGLGM
jgi:hypothetical protein